MKILSGQTGLISSEVENKALILKEAKEMIRLCGLPLGEKPYAYAIAHCQVNHDNPLRFFVTIDREVIINPVILSLEGQSIAHQEGCMSFPNSRNVKVMRNTVAHVSFFDELWVEHVETCYDLRAMIFQHEVDHMDGIDIYSKAL